MYLEGKENPFENDPFRPFLSEMVEGAVSIRRVGGG